MTGRRAVRYSKHGGPDLRQHGKRSEAVGKDLSMSDEAQESGNGKTRKRAAARPAMPVATSKVKATIHMTA